MSRLSSLLANPVTKMKRTYKFLNDVKNDVQSFDEGRRKEIQGYVIGWFYFLVPVFNLFIPIIYLLVPMILVALYYLLSVIPDIESELEH